MNLTQRNSPPEAERLHIYLSVRRAVSSRLPPASAIVTRSICSGLPRRLGSDRRAEGPRKVAGLSNNGQGDAALETLAPRQR